MGISPGIATIQIGKHKQNQDGRTSGRRSIQSSKISMHPQPTECNVTRNSTENSTARKQTRHTNHQSQADKRKRETIEPVKATDKRERKDEPKDKGSARIEAHQSPKKGKPRNGNPQGSRRRSKRSPSPRGIGKPQQARKDREPVTTRSERDDEQNSRNSKPRI